MADGLTDAIESSAEGPRSVSEGFGEHAAVPFRRKSLQICNEFPICSRNALARLQRHGEIVVAMM